MACPTPRAPSEGQMHLGATEDPSSAGFWRTIHLAALRYSVCAEKAVQEDGGQFCHQVPVDCSLGHAVDRTLQTQSKSVIRDEGFGANSAVVMHSFSHHAPLPSPGTILAERHRMFFTGICQSAYLPKELSYGIWCRKFRRKQAYCLSRVKIFFLNGHYHHLPLYSTFKFTRCLLYLAYLI